jgi:hypothetical protein
MSIRRKSVAALIAAAVIALAAGQAKAATPAWPSDEEIQAIAYESAADFGLPGYRIAESTLFVPSPVVPSDNYILGAVGLSDFATTPASAVTIEAGAIKFCLYGQPACNLNPYAFTEYNGIKRRAIQPYPIDGQWFTYRAERVKLDGSEWQALYCGSNGCGRLLGLQPARPITTLPAVYTRGASTGPKWSGIRSVAFKRGDTIPGTNSITERCPAAYDARNTLGPTLPFTTRCNIFNAGFEPPVYTHVWGNNVYIPLSIH